MITTFVALFLVAPFSVKLSKRFGKKEVAAAGMLLSGVVYLLMYFSDFPICGRIWYCPVSGILDLVF